MTDQTQTTTEPVAWRVRRKKEDAGFGRPQVFTTDDASEGDLKQWRINGYDVQPLYTTPQPLAIGLDREALERMVTFAEKLCMAADHYGVKHLDSDDMDDEAVELEAATLCMRHVIADAILALAAPAEGYVLVPVEPTEAMLKAGAENLRFNSGKTQSWCNVLAKPIYRAMIAACLPAAPTGETGA